MLFYDFEVFAYDWLVVVMDMTAKKTHVIINSPEELEALYKAKQNGRNRVEVFHPSDLKNFNPENNAMHKDETANRHPIFDKEPAAEISLLDGIESNHIVDDKNKIEPNKAPGFSVPGVDVEDL